MSVSTSTAATSRPARAPRAGSACGRACRWRGSPRDPARALDALIAGALFAGLTAETLTSSHLHGPVALNVLASAGASLPFAWRRSYPVPRWITVVGAAARGAS